MPIPLRVYLSPYCHLCHAMLERLGPFEAQHALNITTIDIDSNPELEERYGEWIPVLTDAADREICHYFLDESALTAYLTEIAYLKKIG